MRNSRNAFELAWILHTFVNCSRRYMQIAAQTISSNSEPKYNRRHWWQQQQPTEQHRPLTETYTRSRSHWARQSLTLILRAEFSVCVCSFCLPTACVYSFRTLFVCASRKQIRTKPASWEKPKSVKLCDIYKCVSVHLFGATKPDEYVQRPTNHKKCVRINNTYCVCVFPFVAVN